MGNIFSDAILSAATEEVMSPLTFDRVFDKRWAAKDDDVKLPESIVAAVTSTTAASAAAFVLGGAVIATSTLATIVLNLFVFFQRLRKKGVALDRLQFEVLRALKSSQNGKTLDELEGWLIWVGMPVDRAQLEATMTGLERLRLPDGTVTAFVNRAADGRWSAAGL